MNKYIKVLNIVILIIITITVFFSCESDKTEEIMDFIDNYFTIRKTNVADALELTIIPEQFIELQLNSKIKVIDYYVTSIEKVNDNLYAATILVQSSYPEYVYQKIYNFVGFVDEKWYMILNVEHIPKELRQNLDPNKYIYTNPSNLGTDVNIADTSN